MAQKESKEKKDSININLSVKKKSLFIAISVALNIAVIAAVAILAVMHSTGAFDSAYIGLGFDTMCSERFREGLEEYGESGREHLAIMDYRCEREGDAQKYFLKGLAEYYQSLGLEDSWLWETIKK